MNGVDGINKKFIEKYKNKMSKPLTYLMLSRFEHESIIIDGDIIITLFSPRYGQMRVGISAPVDKTILREEVVNRLIKYEEQENG